VTPSSETSDGGLSSVGESKGEPADECAE
jgi:hypothetical protein